MWLVAPVFKVLDHLLGWVGNRGGEHRRKRAGRFDRWRIRLVTCLLNFKTNSAWRCSFPKAGDVCYQHVVRSLWAVQHEMHPRPRVTVVERAHFSEVGALFERFDAADHSDPHIPAQRLVMWMVEGPLGGRHFEVF